MPKLVDPKKIRVVARKSNLRSFTYSAYVSKKTGALLRIKAGCRTWYSFDDAIAHYSGDGRYAPSKWTDAELARKQVNFPSDYRREWAERFEARSILRNLRRDTAKVQRRIRARRA